MQCPQCGLALPAGSPEGLCPRCLLQACLTGSGPTNAYVPGGAAPALDELQELLPQLEFLELLGRGGMGAVYKARQLTLDRLVAVKILPADIGGDPAFAERFQREARALARLNHPNIVAIHDFGQAGGLYYFLMEYVDGVNLRQAMKAGELRPEQALKIVPQICEALQFAHDEGIVHRDIKPENILLDKRSRVKMADFGLAKLLGLEPGELTLTGARQAMGTLYYMAPEQVEGAHAVDHRADIYSLGVTFYEMLTGELPLGRFPLPSQKAAVDARLDDVVLRTLEKDPDRRYQHASEVKSEVETIVQEPAEPRLPPRKKADEVEPLSGPELWQQVQHAGAGLVAAGLVMMLALPLFALLVAALDWMRLLVGLLALQAAWSCAVGMVAMRGGMDMRQGRRYQLAVLSAWLVMVPVTPGVVVGFPLGLWALFVLRRPEVRSEFERLAWLERHDALATAPTLPDDLLEEIKQMDLHRQKILAIKKVMDATGWGLKEAKEAVEDVIYRRGANRRKIEPKPPTPRATASEPGVAYALGWIVGQLLRHGPPARGLAMAIALLGALLIFAPWVETTVILHLRMGQGVVHLPFTAVGLDLWQGLVVGIGFFVLTCLLATFLRRHLPWRDALQLAFGLGATIVAGLCIARPPVGSHTRGEFSSAVLAVHDDFGRRGIPVELPDDQPEAELQWLRQHSAQIQTHARFGAYGSLLLAASLILLSAVELQRSAGPPGPAARG